MVDETCCQTGAVGEWSAIDDRRLRLTPFEGDSTLHRGARAPSEANDPNTGRGLVLVGRRRVAA